MRLFFKAIIFGLLTELVPYLIVHYGDGMFLHLPGFIIAVIIRLPFRSNDAWTNVDILIKLTVLCSVALYSGFWYLILKSKIMPPIQMINHCLSRSNQSDREGH
jgi:hypothetical protein